MLDKRERGLLDDLWRREAGLMRSYMVRWAGDVDVAEEAVAEVFWRACRALARGHPPRSSARGWLWRILHNYCVDLMRQTARMPVLISLDEEMGNTGDCARVDCARVDCMCSGRGALHTDMRPAASYALDDALEGALEGALAFERCMQVREAVGRLSIRQAALVVLRHYRGHDLADIAQAFGISYGAAKAIHHRALAGLRREVDPPGTERPVN